MIAVVFTLVFGLAGSIVVKQNVVFQKTNEIATTRAKWLASFIVDLKPFDDFLNGLQTDIGTAQTTAECIVQKYQKPQDQQYANAFKALNKEIMYLNETRAMIANSFNDVKTLHKRSRRALMLIIGRAMSWLFGVVFESDLDGIKSNINALSKNQKRIVHVVEQSLSILNTSRIQIRQNRQSVTELIISLHQLDKKLEFFV